MDKFEAAKRVFAIFQKHYENRLGEAGIWALTFDGDDEAETGLTGKALRVGVAVLKHNGLVKQMTADSYRLTEEGQYLCLHPMALEDVLGPPTPPAPTQQFNIHAQQLQAAQFGNNNVMTTTYGTVIEGLVGAIDTDENIADATKSRWKEVLTEIAASTVSSVAVALAGRALG